MVDFSTVVLLIVLLIAFIGVIKGVCIAPQQEAWIIERLGRYSRTLDAGLTIIVPYIERVAYRHSLKETAYDVQEQTAITRDNVTLTLDGIVYLRVTDAVAACYGVTDPIYAITQLAQTTMRSEIGKLTMDQTFEERDKLNHNIVEAINAAAGTWGIQCMRYEIRNIHPPKTVLQAMELQVAAERQKRAQILESEGKRQAQINMAEGHKQEVVLKSEAALTDQVNRAKGEGEAILTVAHATAESLRQVAQAISQSGGMEAMNLRVAEQYVEAFRQLAQKSTTVLLPASAGDAASMVAQALTVFDRLREGKADIMTSPRGSVPKV
ncbi:MAG: SPFH domain-containing protein [Holosporales bacterium]|jgi:regulator of protease activity HflC (stomatin/prohibitin superfamily)